MPTKRYCHLCGAELPLMAKKCPACAEPYHSDSPRLVRGSLGDTVPIVIDTEAEKVKRRIERQVSEMLDKFGLDTQLLAHWYANRTVLIVHPRALGRDIHINMESPDSFLKDLEIELEHIRCDPGAK